MTRQEIFEAHYAAWHDLPPKTMQQYRWIHQDGYRLPAIAAAYRNFCAGWDAQVPTIDALLNHCDKDNGECHQCSAIICPHHDGMHFHHDGCPSCAQAEGEHP